MKSFARLPLCAGVAVVLVSTFVFLLLQLGDKQTKDYLDVMKWASTLGDALHKQEALEVRSEPVFRRTFEKSRITHELITHQIAPREAVAQLHELNEEVAEAEPNPDLRPPLDEQSLWSSLMVAVRAELSNDPRAAEDVAAELEREMNEQSGAGG